MAWDDALTKRLDDADSALAAAVAEMRSAIGELDDETAAMHISPRSPRVLEDLAGEMRRLIGDAVDDD